MIIYNITTKVHSAVDHAWLQWQREEYIPAIMDTGAFLSFTICRLLEQDDSEGNTYALQLTAPSEAAYQSYLDDHAVMLRRRALEKWNESTISFHSVLEVIHH